MRKKLIFICSAILLSAIFSITSFSQQFAVTSFEIKRAPDSYGYGELFIIINGQSKKIADATSQAWIISYGQEVIFTGKDGAGGYENEGQSLYIYNAKTGRSRKILSQYYMILGLSEFKIKNGQSVLLVRMEDGGLGASYVSVVDPKRGEVFFEPFAEIDELTGDKVKLLYYKEGDWEAINQARTAAFYENKNSFPSEKTKVPPYKAKIFDLKKLLTNNVIKRKHTMEILDAGLKNVKIYLWRVNDNEGSKPFVLGTVERQVSSSAPLRPTLEELFRGTTKDEEEKGFGSVTFGMKFEGVVLKNGVATVKFSQPKGQTNYGSAGPFIFSAAIEKTVKQFPTVKNVVVCAIGETLIDAQSEKQFPRCK